MDNEYSIEHIRNVGIKVIVVFSLLAAGVFGIFHYVKSNTEVFNIDVQISNNNSIKPDETVSLFFSNKVNMGKTSKAVRIEPKIGHKLKWSEDGKALAITPIGHWKNSQIYKVYINEGSSSLGFKFSAESSFSIEKLPKVVSISPLDGEKDVLVDIEDPIVIGFDRSIEDYSVKIDLSPAGDFSRELDSQKKNIKIMPQKSLEYGKKYEIFVKIKYKQSSTDDEFEDIFRSSFETKKMEIKEWSKDIPIRLFQAKNYTEPKIQAGKYIDINLKGQVMVIFENGIALDSYLISSGRAGMNTPQGSFEIRNKHPRPWSKKYSLFMPYWMAVVPSGEFGIHELPEWPGGYKEGANHLGIPVSHGCIRLGVGPAERVYNWAEIGTPVIIHY